MTKYSWSCARAVISNVVVLKKCVARHIEREIEREVGLSIAHGAPPDMISLDVVPLVSRISAFDSGMVRCALIV